MTREEQRAEHVRLSREGLTTRQIAERTGASQSTVSRDVRHLTHESRSRLTHESGFTALHEMDDGELLAFVLARSMPPKPWSRDDLNRIGTYVLTPRTAPEIHGGRVRRLHVPRADRRPATRPDLGPPQLSESVHRRGPPQADSLSHRNPRPACRMSRAPLCPAQVAACRQSLPIVCQRADTPDNQRRYL